MPITDIAPITPLIHLYDGELCVVGKKRWVFLYENKLLEKKSCLKAPVWKFGTATESFPLPTLATSSLLFIKTLTQWEKYIDRIKKRGGEKSLSKKVKKRQTEKENLLHVFFVLIVISLLKFSFLFKYFDNVCSSPAWTRGDMTSSNREEEKLFLFNLIG